VNSEAPIATGIGSGTSSGRSPDRRGLQHFVDAHDRFILGSLGILTILIAWEIGAATRVLNPIIFSSPSGIVRAAGRELQNGDIWHHVAVSALEFAIGFGLAAVLGVVIGFVAGWWKRANAILDPWVTILYNLPTVALMPLIILIMGIGLWSKVFVIFLIALFPVVVNTMVGVQNTARSLIDVARVFGASSVRQWKTVVVPGATPYMLTGLRLAGGRALIGVVVAELIAGNEGIGFAIHYAGSLLQGGTVMLYILILGFSGIAFAEVMRRVEDRFESWRPSGGRRAF
jgi:NitT/TauT family transport system permease protein